MKRIIFTSCVLLMCIIDAFSQTMEQKINFVISIDNKVVTTITDAKLILEQNKQSININIGYIPGELTLDNADYERIMQNQGGSLFLTFKYYEYEKDRQIIYTYEIELKKIWFEQSFRVLRIYNLNKKENRKIFYPLEGKEYTYEIDLPSNSITRIRKE